MNKTREPEFKTIRRVGGLKLISNAECHECEIWPIEAWEISPTRLLCTPCLSATIHDNSN